MGDDARNRIDNGRRKGVIMNKLTKFAGFAAAALVAGAIGTGVATAAGGDDDATDVSITGSDLDKASAAALEHTGGGHVTGTETNDEESYYEVEVTRDDGSVVDVQLNRSFNVVSSDGDHDGAEDDQ
jgi:uncharacterized membrane protein YkoI